MPYSVANMDPYVYPGTNVLKNLRDLRDDRKLRQYETDATTLRINQLKKKRLPGSFEAGHLQAIHRHIFQDVFEWAGEFRTVDIGFTPWSMIDANLGRMSAELKSERYLLGMAIPQFASRAAHYLGQLNAIHPFREGNGRAQNEYIRHLAALNSLELSWNGVSHEELYESARRSYLQSDNSGLERILLTALGTTHDQAPD